MPVPDELLNLVNSLEKNPPALLLERIEKIIADLINNDFGALVELLYRVDIDEKKLKELLQANVDKDAASIIAGLIISRQLKKIFTRDQFKNKEKPSGDDSW